MQYIVFVDKSSFQVVGFVTSNDWYDRKGKWLVINNDLVQPIITNDRVDQYYISQHDYQKLTKFDFNPDKFKFDGDTYSIKHTNPDVEFVEMWHDVRQKRDRLLAESDKKSGIQWPDLWASRTDEQKLAWTQYRQTLRDITTTYNNPDAVEWPQLPTTQQT